MSPIQAPPLDFTLSPYTGWTYAHWEHLLARATYGYVRAAEKRDSYARALFPDDRRDSPDAVDALESFARISTAWGAYLHNSQNPATLDFENRKLNLEEILTQALLDGTNPSNLNTYWGEIRDFDQRIVEAADIAVTLWLSRDRVFLRLGENERAQIIRWLEQVDKRVVYSNNWTLFPVLPMTLRHKLGYPANTTLIDSHLDEMAAFYRGDGWYADGVGSHFDLYNAWMFGWHYLMWAWLDGARRPAYLETLERRARSFLAGFQYFFGANGAYPAWGRSLTYRFAAISCFAAGHLLHISPVSAGGMRRLSSGCIKYFYERECFDPHGHFLRQGFHGAFPPVIEPYISPGSPLWACRGLLALAFARDDPFWTEVEEPLPVERGDFDIAFPTPGFNVSGRRAGGEVFLLNAGSGFKLDNPRHPYHAKYGKLVYSSHFPFNVLLAGSTYAPDAMIALTADDENFGHRSLGPAHGAAPGVIWCDFEENIAKESRTRRLARRVLNRFFPGRIWMPRVCQPLHVAILIWRDIQLRLVFVEPTMPVRVVEAPGALGCAGATSVTRLSNAQEGWEYAQAEGRALAIQRLYGFDDQCPSRPFRGYSSINLAYPYAEQPLVLERVPSRQARCLAAATLLRPAPFEPSKEFAGIQIDAGSDGSFQLTLPDGESAYVSLANELPSIINIENHAIQGEGIRCVRVNPASGYVLGMGITRITGICELDSSGTFQLKRESDGVFRVTTNAGFRLAAEWLRGTASKIESQALDSTWLDVTDACTENHVPQGVVQEWAKRNDRTLIEFRLTRGDSRRDDDSPNQSR